MAMINRSPCIYEFMQIDRFSFDKIYLALQTLLLVPNQGNEKGIGLWVVGSWEMPMIKLDRRDYSMLLPGVEPKLLFKKSFFFRL